MNLFSRGNFTSSAGLELSWKIECDALTDEDIETLAHAVHEKMGAIHFRKVVSVPRGGDRLAGALGKYLDPNGGRVLIVDDVLTTGASMERARNAELRYTSGVQISGVVIFSRVAWPPSWIYPIFRMTG